MGKKIQCIGRYVMDGVVLGKGNFARVELATHMVTGCKVAIKIIDQRKIKEVYTKENLHREPRILAQIRHPHIIRLYETLKATTLYCLVLEYAAGGDLLTFIKSQKDGRLPDSKARAFFRQLVSAVHFLHERGVSHRDLKMENILLDEKHINVKVIDFGLSNTFTPKEGMKTHCGSMEYAAPELIATTDKYGPEVDIWSLGIILYSMVVGKLPFHTHYTDQYRRQKLLAQIEQGLTENHIRELSLHGASTDLQHLLTKLIEPAVERRMSLSDCELHPWVTSGGRVPFTPFQALPRDRQAKTQAIDELAAILETPRDQVEATVHESKCDDFSAMFNMLLDAKRNEKGLFDTDFTQKQEARREKQKKKYHKGKKDKAKAKQATPSILCPDIEVPTEPEEFQKTSHNSTSFDLMAICSAPTWLGGDRRKTRRRRSPMPPPSPMPVTEGAKAELDVPLAAGGQDLSASLLSPTQASTQVAQLLRRNSSRRRSYKGNSTGSQPGTEPPSRSGSIRRHARRKPSSPGSGGSNPNSPRSPIVKVNPQIKIDTPNQSPMAAIKRPANLIGLKECYDVKEPKGLKRHQTLDPHMSYSSFSRRTTRKTRFGSDKTDGADSVQSEGSFNCSTTNLHEVLSDGSQEVFSNPESPPGYRTSFGSFGDKEPTVESKIAAADIRSIVRPKHVDARNVQSTVLNNTSNPHLAKDDKASFGMLTTSPEIKIKTMQSKPFANLSDDEKLERQMNCDLPKTDSDKRIDQEQSKLLLLDAPHVDDLHSSTEMLGAASMKPQRASYVLHGAVGSKNFQENDHVFTSFCVEAASDEKGKGMYATFERYHEPLLADLYSKREKISLHENDKILMQDADDYDGFCDSSDHNSSHENLLGHERTLLRRGRNKPVRSIGSESISAPLLLTSNELGLTLTPGDSPGDSLAEPSKYGSLMSSRRSSSPSVRFVMPNTPSRQLFNTPIARIESFHSDDFETYTSDYGAFVTARNSSPSPNSIQTPTVPCFQLYSRKKKHVLTSKSKRKHMNGARDGKQCYQDDKSSRKDFRSGDAMMSSDTDYGSDGQVPDGEKLQSSHKARIFPMENSDDQIDGKAKINDKAIVISDITANQNSSCSRIHQNSNCKSQLWKPNQQEHEVKKSIWHRGFVHLLKKKKQASSRLSGNNNNDIENASRNRQNNSSLNSSPNNTGNNNANCNAANVTNTRNGHTRGVIRAIPPNTLDIQATTVQITWKQPPKHHNNINLPKVAEAGLPDNCPSITHSPSPASKTRVFDYSNVPSHSHKTKHSMLSWKACRACTFSADLSSNEGSDANISDTICNQVGKGESCIIPMTSLKTGTSSVENGNSRT